MFLCSEVPSTFCPDRPMAPEWQVTPGISLLFPVRLRNKPKCPVLQELLCHARAMQWTIMQPLKMFSKTFMMRNVHCSVKWGRTKPGVGGMGLIKTVWAVKMG